MLEELSNVNNYNTLDQWLAGIVLEQFCWLLKIFVHWGEHTSIQVFYYILFHEIPFWIHFYWSKQQVKHES